jgi:lipopolysaccharide transport system permease protein
MIKSSVVLENPHVPEWIKVLYQCNPMVAVIDGFRWCLFGNEFELNAQTILFGTGITVVFLISGVLYFRKVEKNFADII